MTTRSEILLAPISRDALIAEVGASFNPIAPKHEGWNTKTIDVGTKSELIDKYRGHLPGADIDRIEEVDFIWRDGPLSGAVPSELHGAFDVFIASHVIEHSPDLLAFLESAATLLASTGTVIFAIPDKRFCFDYFRPLAMTGDILASHRLGRTRHTKQTIFNHHAYVVSANGIGAWGQHSVQNLAFFNPLEAAYSAFLTCSEDDASPYVDMHAWQFTPASFELLLLELARLKATDWKVDRLSPIPGCEFHAWLSRGGEQAAAALTESELNEQRLALLKRTLLEAKEQIEFLMPSHISAEFILAAERERRLRAECSTLQSRLTDQATTCDAVRRERDCLAAASARWFQAAIAVTDDDNLVRVSAGKSSRLSRIARRLNGCRRRPSPMSLADRARDARKWELAVRYYRDALNLNPDEPRIWVQYGHALKESGKVSEAEVVYRKALELDPKNADTTAALGHSLALQGKSVEAAAGYRQALALDPAPGLRLGLLNELQGDQVGAPGRRAENRSGFEAMDENTIEFEFGSEFLALWRLISGCTIVSLERAYATYRACRYVARYKIDGCFAECGVFKGGMAMLAAAVFAKYADAARDILLFDTFSGMTAPSEIDMSRHGVSAATYDPELVKSSLDEVRRNLAKTGYPSHHLHYIEGDVCATLRNPVNVPNSIAILRLDTDWYDSTRTELEVLYEKVSPGGVVLIDDYGYWLGARKAVDEFIERLSDPVYLCRTDNTGIEFVKPHKAAVSR